MNIKMKTAAVAANRTSPGELNRYRPVVGWAKFGAVYFAVMLYMLIRWVLSDDFRPTDPGPTPIPDFMRMILPVVCLVNIVAGIVLTWLFVIKPWRREGVMTTDGAIAVSCLLIWWQDPLQNLVAPWFIYNSWLPNMGSWAAGIPGLLMPHAERLAHPLYFSIPGFYLFFGMTLLGSAAMSRAKVWKPNISIMSLFLIAFAFVATTFLLIEITWMRSGAYVYPYVIEELTLFAGHYYQIPIYEPIILGLVLAGYSCLHHFRNDKGETFAERGLSGMTISPRRKSALRFLSTFAIINTLFMGYNIALQPFILNADGIPEDILKRSYFMNEYCGPGADIACWNKALPISTRHSAKVNPAGELVPGKLPIPAMVPFQTE